MTTLPQTFARSGHLAHVPRGRHDTVLVEDDMPVWSRIKAEVEIEHDVDEEGHPVSLARVLCAWLFIAGEWRAIGLDDPLLGSIEDSIRERDAA